MAQRPSRRRRHFLPTVAPTSDASAVLVCMLCNNAQPQSSGPFVKLDNCQDRFHFQCLLAYFLQLLRSAGLTQQQPTLPCCPRCRVDCARPEMPNVMMPLRRPKTVWKNIKESHVWEWITYHLRTDRDSEAQQLSFRPEGFQPPPDVTRQALLPTNTNYFEMVNACWVCRQLIGNEHWVALPSCGHAFHTFCLVATFYEIGTDSEVWLSMYPCPLCERPAQLEDHNHDAPLSKACSDHLMEMATGGAWYCLHYRYRLDRTAQPVRGSIRGVKRSHPEVNDESSFPSRNVRPRRDLAQGSHPRNSIPE